MSRTQSTTMLLSLASASLLLGCPNPNMYATARTTPKGEISHSVSPEAFGYSGKERVAHVSGGSPVYAEENVSGTVPTFPSYTLRYGIAEDMELSFRVANASSVGAEYKFNFVKGDVFDMAVAPSAQYFRISARSDASATSTAQVAYLNLPLVFDLNLSKSATIVLHPGISYAYSSASLSEGKEAAVSAGGTFASAGVGVNLRPSHKFGLQPEITFMRGLKEEHTTIYLAGIGLNFGSLPIF